MSGKYPSTYYQVSLRAIIRNDKDEVLVGKLSQPGANHDKWDLIGGGMEHGETDQQALAREMHEEASITAPFNYTPIGIESVWNEKKQRWWLGIYYEVIFQGRFSYAPGKDTWDCQFLDPEQFRDSLHDTEQLIYKWAVKKSPR